MELGDMNLGTLKELGREHWKKFRPKHYRALIGNPGRDSEQKFLQNGGSVCSFSLGTTESYTKDGEQKERTEWHNVVFFGKLAEIAGEYLSKGSRVYVPAYRRQGGEPQDGEMGGQRRQPEAGNKGHWIEVNYVRPQERQKDDDAEFGPHDDVPF